MRNSHGKLVSHVQSTVRMSKCLSFTGTQQPSDCTELNSSINHQKLCAAGTQGILAENPAQRKLQVSCRQSDTFLPGCGHRCCKARRSCPRRRRPPTRACRRRRWSAAASPWLRQAAPLLQQHNLSYAAPACSAHRHGLPAQFLLPVRLVASAMRLFWTDMC